MRKNLYIKPAFGMRSMESMALLAGSGDLIEGEISEGNAGGKTNSIWHWMAE